LEQDPVDDAENSRAGADSEGETSDGGGGKTGRPAQRAQSKANIVVRQEASRYPKPVKPKFVTSTDETKMSRADLYTGYSTERNHKSLKSKISKSC
jgi:hypothetical protein